MPKATVTSDDLMHLTAAAHKGNAEAQNLLGVYYATGAVDGVCDNVYALKWYLEAAKVGLVESLWNAGSMLVDGEEGVEMDSSFGLLLIRLSADSFQPSACSFLSWCYKSGLYGLLKDEDKYEYWMEASLSYKKIQQYTNSVELEIVKILCGERWANKSS
jgi:TPR repeat protein